VISEDLGVLVVTEPAAVLTSPSDSDRIVHVAGQGASFRVVGVEGNFYRVEIPDPRLGRRIGYIEKKYVAPQSAAAVRYGLLPTQKPWPPAMDLSVPESGFYSNSLDPLNLSVPNVPDPTSLEPIDLSVPPAVQPKAKRKPQ
jgi:hypothetical protein